MHINRFAVRAIREAKQVTVSGLARDSGIGQAHLSNIEAGRRKVSDEVIVKLAENLGVDIRAITHELAA
jgi:transcriptional regulator with XRE-family HTH domain